MKEGLSSLGAFTRSSWNIEGADVTGKAYLEQGRYARSVRTLRGYPGAETRVVVVLISEGKPLFTRT